MAKINQAITPIHMSYNSLKQSEQATSITKLWALHNHVHKHNLKLVQNTHLKLKSISLLS